MMGTFGSALEARQIDASNGRLTADVISATEEGVLVIRSIHVAMHLAAAEDVTSKIERVHEMYAMHCPMFHTLHKAIQLTSSWTLEQPTIGSRA